MKQFNSLLDAICFNTHCPSCENELRSDSLTNSNQKVALKLLSKNEDVIYIDVITHDVEIVNDSGWLQSQNNDRGTLVQGITVSCYDCCMYSFMIQIWIDLNNLSVFKICLNYEEVSWEDENRVLHEIISYHSTDRVKYSYYNPEGSDNDGGQIILPFMNVDVYNPKCAVDRIKKLLVFS